MPDTVYQRIAERVDAWRAEGYRRDQYPASAEVLERRRDPETGAPRYLEACPCIAPGFLDTSLAVIMQPLRCSARAPGGRRPGCGGRGARPATSGCSGP